ncbi:hypothetical protein [Bacillus pinisoli]|uniref:hypothetical protein n=1 Tax=Bacillus pinisoli TaxID=2901866 RepID=UPI001FF6AFBA|nr:hypothetical protein [Bacillus pinisoli]
MSRIVDNKSGPPYFEYLILAMLSLLTFRKVSWIELRILFFKEEISKHHKRV